MRYENDNRRSVTIRIATTAIQLVLYIWKIVRMHVADTPSENDLIPDYPAGNIPPGDPGPVLDALRPQLYS